jgi:hypothetical protein
MKHPFASLPFHEGVAPLAEAPAACGSLEGATRAGDNERSEIEGVAPLALPVEGATRAP